MKVRAVFHKATGVPVAGMKVAWWVPAKTGTFELRDTGVTNEAGVLEMEVSSATFGSHLRLGSAGVATFPVKMSSTLIDYGTMVVLEPAREDVRAVSSAAVEPTQEPALEEGTSLVLSDKLKSAGQQIEAVRASLTTVRLSTVRVRWMETTPEGVTEAEAQFVEQSPAAPETGDAPAREVPDFRGLTASAARRRAAEAGLRVDPMPLFVKEPGQWGRVLRQVPEPGKPLASGPVQLIIGQAMEG
ncbi:PASTA domain-containing protein [Corallococcus sp. AS-1-12]|uniref:PASTA domain-containing protein n=1 Tax=Corallococcus sp. AS-1-12 TaxID=2874598 RepID=UPI001CBE608D|nr:PASTA domain-containing protein [Corallococcus sp. AS-1-12]MBZ4332904.1 PASTA domain-containing protein [Corallococcus sp. AS-1-12]